MESSFPFLQYLFVPLEASYQSTHTMQSSLACEIWWDHSKFLLTVQVVILCIMTYLPWEIVVVSQEKEGQMIDQHVDELQTASYTPVLEDLFSLLSLC